jgi:Flp pilus assembly protein TadG
MVLALIVLLGFAGLVIDLGRVYVAQRQLQQAVDSAALAAGQDLPDSVSAHASAIAYGGTGSNKEPDMTANAPVVSFKCLQTLVSEGVACQTDSTNGGSAYCTLSSGCNSVQVTESASVSTTLLGMFLPRFTTVSATSTVSAHGGRERPLDVMVVLDTTGSMRNDAQSDVCPTVHDPSKLDCAKAGVLTLLDELEPCATGQSCTSGNALDRVGLMAFPPLVDSNLRSNETGGPGTHSHSSCTLNSSEVSYDDSGTTSATSNVTPTGTISNGSKTISSLSSVTGIQVGSSISGSGISSGTTVTAVSASHLTVTISKSATSSRSHVTLTFTTTTTTSNTSTDPTASGSYTYTVVPLENSYASWLGNTWQLNSSDPLVAALSTSSSCSLQALSSSDTSFATAIDQAQAALAAEDDWSTHDHAIVFLGDGEANYGPIYTSPDDSPVSPYRSTPCQQAAASAEAAAAPTTSNTGTTQAGTTIYAIGYWESTSDQDTSCNGVVGTDSRGRSCNDDTGNVDPTYGFGDADQFDCYETAAAGTTDPTGCDSESRPITGCWTIAHIASDPSTFFQDPSDTDITTIFNEIATDLTAPRLFPDNTQ